ncbi:MAG: tRNA (adenosine(37)-N6)-dimethylallyltransferase MiaA [Candidatus Eisenbacteria bacterium]
MNLRRATQPSDRVVGLLIGPTAVGKSDLAIRICEARGWELISLDSRQVYRGLAIGTAQPSGSDLARVPHHLVACLDPRETCSAARYREMCAVILDDLQARDARALVVGGTGLYWRALTEGLHRLPTASASLRAQHATILEEEGVEGLRRRLEALDPHAAARLGARDRQRLGRALEIVELTGRSLAANLDAPPLPPLVSQVAEVVLTRPRPELHARIQTRCDQMLASGLIDELRGVLASGCPTDAPGLRTVRVSATCPLRPRRALVGQMPGGVRARDATLRQAPGDVVPTPAPPRHGASRGL